MASIKLYMAFLLQLLFWYTVYGQTENSTCSNCACCFDRICTDNSTCDHGCSGLQWASNCTFDCPELCSRCSPRDGNCYSGYCEDGYFDSQCNATCPNNCVKCSSSKNCSKCKDGYYKGRYKDTSGLSYFSDCRYACRENCTKCSSYNYCSECKPGHAGRTCLATQNTTCLDCACCVDGTCSDKSTCDRGCSDLHWGDDCSYDCPNSCTKCYRSSGNCYKYSCIDGKYGSQCHLNCSKNCETCRYSSSCSTCKDGYHSGRYKDLSGSSYYYDCRHRCRENCTKCTSYNMCSSCKPNHFGQKCEKDQLKNTCPNCSCCLGELCTLDKTGESCDHGCKDGYWGNECWYECPELCTQCRRTTGNCYSYKCVPGYYGSTCNGKCLENCLTCYSSTSCSTCKNGTYKGYYKDISSSIYRSDCSYSCHENCTTCLRYGSCTGCKSGYYGSMCQFACSSGCSAGACNITGDCIDGCRPGFSGEMCEQCEEGKYGTQCGNNCSDTCYTKSCDRSSGACAVCKYGYKGSTCSEVIGKLSTEGAADNTGHIYTAVGSTIGVLLGMLVGSTCSFLVMRHFRKKKEETSSHTNPVYFEAEREISETPTDISYVEFQHSY